MATLEKYYKVTAKLEYEKNPLLSASDVYEVLQWSNENINLHGKFIDIQIIMFLHACNYNKEYAKKVIRYCYNLRAKKCACFFSARDPAHPFNLEQLDVVNFNINPDDDTGYSYMWSNIKNFDSSIYYPTVGTKLLFMAIELDQIENGTKSGYRLLLDANHVTFSHALRFSLTHAKHLMEYVQEATCFTIEKIYILNVTSAVDRIFSMMKPFMSSSLLNKIEIKSASKSKEFLKTLPQNVVPKDYNGLALPLNEANEILKKKLLDNRNYFLDEEKLRNGKVKDEMETTANGNHNSDNDGINSFKSLCID